MLTGESPVLVAVEQPTPRSVAQNNHLHTSSWVLGSGGRTGPDETLCLCLKMSRAVAHRWLWQLGLLVQKAWLYGVSWASIGARCGQLLTEHFHVAPPSGCQGPGSPHT